MDVDEDRSDRPTPADETAERWIVEPGQSRTITVEGVDALKVGLIGGQVDVVGHDEPTTRVEVHSVKGKPFEVTLDGGRLTVSHPRVRWSNLLDSLQMLVGDRASAEVSILVPRETTLSFGQVSSEALISGMRRGASISTVSGDVQIDAVTGPVDVNTVSGAVEGTGLDGSVQVHGVSGEVALTGTMSTVGVDTVSGGVLLDVHGRVSSIGINSVSGDATARIDADLDIDASCNTVSGTTTIGSVQMPKRGGKHVDRASVPSSGTVRASLNSVSGDQSVVRRA